MIWKIVGLILMGLCQYWIYSTFWISESDVTKVGGVIHITSDILSIECKTIPKPRGGEAEEYNILLKNGQRFELQTHGTVKSCEHFYLKFEQSFNNKKANGDSLPSEYTTAGQQFYSPIIFGGYFRNRTPLEISFDEQVWLSYKILKEEVQSTVLLLSFTPIFLVVIVKLGLKSQREKDRKYLESLKTKRGQSPLK